MFIKTAVAAALAAIVAANTVDMVSQDSAGRTVYFVPQEGSPEIPSLRLDGGETVTAEFPDRWIGNFYAVRDEADRDDTDGVDGNGMLGEVRFDGSDGLNFFDVSAIVAPDDAHNVKVMYPKNEKSPTSGCQNYDTECPNAYNYSDDIQTKSSEENEFVCLIGDLEATKRRHAREIFTKRW